MYKKILYSAILGVLYGFLCDLIIPQPYTLPILLVGAIPIAYFYEDVYKFFFGEK